jgi:hypothetical protein
MIQSDRDENIGYGTDRFHPVLAMIQSDRDENIVADGSWCSKLMAAGV